MCGEHVGTDLFGKSGCGSSPRVRGTQDPVCRLHHHHRFIPACAGNTLERTSLASPDAVHPRVCGEHNDTEDLNPEKFGSSPRVRGTLQKRRVGIGMFRFIPACAGNTQGKDRLFLSIPVHPRVCGEHVRRRIIHINLIGSSPRVRGTPPAGCQGFSR